MGSGRGWVRAVRVCAVVGLTACWAWASAGVAHAREADGGADLRAAVTVPAAYGSARLERTAPCGPVWDITAEAGLTLFEDPDGILGEQMGTDSQPFRYGVNTFDPGFAARLTVGYSTGRRTRWEVRAAWLGSVDASSRQTGRFGFRSAPGAPLLLSPLASTALTSETEVWSGEVNWWKTCSCDPCSQLDWGIGARVIGVDDDASATNWVGLAPDSFLEAEIDNRFYGAQLMAAWRQRPSSTFSWAASGKVILGWMNRDMSEADTSIVTGGVTTSGAREETGFSWGFELEVSAMWRVMSRIGITASYTLLYLDEVSRVGDSLDFGQAATGSLQWKDNGDTALFHSFFVGVRIDI